MMDDELHQTDGGPSPTSDILFANRYRILSLIGSGGMGKIYKAYDSVLGRNVALKFVLTDDPNLERRLLREAQAQAKVEHDCVCKIYDLGQAEGKFYIAMQYIDGVSIGDAQKSLTLDQKVLLIKQVAEGIHSAHRIGLIHRDIKPSNIMLERTGEGVLKPLILDFGLVRDTTQPDQSRTGMVHGTPQYMSPEQALGEVHKLDRRSDVYSLGATFYELLTGRVPIEGTGVDLFVKLLETDPVPIHKWNSSLPTDLQTIVMKCLEKEPERRYPSALELSDDLQRYLNGEPIRARPSTWTYRIAKKAKRHRITVGIAVVAFIVIGILLGMWLRARWTATERAELAQQLGQDVMRVENTLRQIYTLPIHDIRKEKQAIRTEMENLTGRILERIGRVGQAPGNYALGRTYFLLQDYPKAREYLEKSWSDGYRTTDVSHVLGSVYGEIYKQELTIAERIDNDSARKMRTEEIKRLYRDPALSHLSAAVDSTAEASAFIEAEMAYYRGDYKKALEKAASSKEKSPWLYEADILQGAIFHLEGNRVARTGDVDEAIEYYSKADQAYRKAIRIGESDIRGYEGLCNTWNQAFYTELNSKERNVELYKKRAIEMCGKALMIDAHRSQSIILLSRIYSLWAIYETYHGLDPSDSLERSLKFSRDLLRLDPSNAEAHMIMGRAQWLQGNWEIHSGKDPLGSYRAAVVSATKAIENHPNFYDAFNILGLAYLDIGNWNLVIGVDPIPSLEQSADAYRRAIQIDPESMKAILNLGLVYLSEAEYQVTIGEDPRPKLDQALEQLTKAIRIEPTRFISHRFLAYTYRVQGQYESQVGMDPLQSVEKGLSAIEKALELNKNDLLAYLEVAALKLVQAQEDVKRGRSPSDSLASLYDAVETALKIDPAYADILDYRGRAELLDAAEVMKKGGNPEKFLIKAEATFKKAIQLTPEKGVFYVSLAEVSCRRVERKLALKQNPSVDIKEGQAFVDRALEKNPSLAEAYVTRGILNILLSRTQEDPEKRKELARAGRDSILKGTTLNGNLAMSVQPYLEQAKDD